MIRRGGEYLQVLMVLGVNSADINVKTFKGTLPLMKG
jgi:hypothetical protein